MHDSEDPEPPPVTTQSVLRSGHLPAPQLGILPDIERAIKGLARTHVVKERICEYIQQEVRFFAVHPIISYHYHVELISLSIYFFAYFFLLST